MYAYIYILYIYSIYIYCIYIYYFLLKSKESVMVEMLMSSDSQNLPSLSELDPRKGFVSFKLLCALFTSQCAQDRNQTRSQLENELCNQMSEINPCKDLPNLNHCRILGHTGDESIDQLEGNLRHTLCGMKATLCTALEARGWVRKNSRILRALSSIKRQLPKGKNAACIPG